MSFNDAEPATARPSSNPSLERSPETTSVLQGTVVTSEQSVSQHSISPGRSIALISCITAITAIGNLLAGLLTVCIPVIAVDLDIPYDLQLWPAAAFALACGCTLIACGALADILGCRRACLLGALVQSVSAMGAGLVGSATQLIALRALAGIAASLCLPGAVGVASRAFPAGSDPKRRNAAFAAMGGGQAVGFGLGLVLGGVCAEKIGWQWGFYGTAILNGAVLLVSFWALPPLLDDPLDNTTLRRLRHNIDWLGASIISVCLALLSYELAMATGLHAQQNLSRPLNIALLSFAGALVPAFCLWMRWQVRHGRPALIPNALWNNKPFTAVCVAVFMTWGALNASEQLLALYLQDVLERSVLTASLYFLPAPICGILLNVAMGLLLPYIRPSWTVPAACIVSGIAPLLLATLCRTNGPAYWEGIFQAMALNPVGADIIYVIANLVLTDAFPRGPQALAGSVFNTLAQLGKSVGIATTAIIARRISVQSEVPAAKDALLRGYKAGWLFDCAMCCLSVSASVWGLRKVRRLGTKRD